MRLISISIACLTFALLESCGTSRTGRELRIAWMSDGNPGVPVCGEAQVNCKSAIEILDRTSGVAVTVPVSDLSYVAPAALDGYEVRVTGYNGQGKQLASSYEVVQ